MRDPDNNETYILKEFTGLTDLVGDGPGEDLDYFSLCFGFLVGKDIESERAYELASYARYELGIA